MSKLIQTKRLLAMVMAVLLLVSLVPVTAFAEMDNGLAGWKGTTVDYNSVDNFYKLQFDGISYGNADDLVLRATANTNVQMIRAGKTYTVGAPGQDTFVIWAGGETGYIRVSQFHANLANSGLADGEAAPRQGDVFVVSGDFADEDGNVIITVETTYITVGAEGALTFSTEAPEIEPAADLFGLQNDGLQANDDGSYLLKYNGTSLGNSDTLVLQPTENSNIQQIRNGKTYNVAATGQDTLVVWGGGANGYIKVSQFYANLANSGLDSAVPQEGDVYVISGTFQTSNGATTVSVETTYITVGAEGALTFSTEAPVIEAQPDLFGLQNDGLQKNSDSEYLLKYNGTSLGNSDTLVLQPTENSNIQQIRNGKTYNVAATGQDTLVVWGGGANGYIKVSQYYANLANSGLDSAVPQEGDVYVISGTFQTSDGGTQVTVEKTYILVGSDNTLSFTTEQPDISCKHTSTTETTVESTFTAPGYTKVVCDTCKEEISRTEIAQLSANVQSWNVTLNDNIRVNFALTLSVPDVSKAKVRVSVADVAQEYDISGLPCENGVYSLSVDLAATQMTDALSVSFLYGESVSSEKTYSVRSYADTVLNGAYSAATKALVREMLTYGGAAQTYFGYQTERLASEGITGTAQTEIPVSCDAMSVSGSISGVAYYGASLVYRNRIAVRLYFTGDVSGCTFQIGEQQYTPASQNGLSYIEVSGILPQNLQKAIALTVTSGEDSLSVTYSPMNYIVRMNAKDDANLKNLLKALYNYHLAAEYYLTAPATIVVEGGTLAEHADGAELSENMIFVSLTENLLPGDEDDGVAYAANDGVIKLVRGGNTLSLSGSIVKYEDGASYELNLEGDALPMQHNDYLIVEGEFANTDNNFVLNISKTYILNTNGTLSFTTTEPVIVSVVEAGNIVAAENTALNGGVGFNFNMTNGSVIPMTTEGDWDNRFMPKTADTVKLIRDGVTTSIGNVAAGEFVKYSANGYYMDIAVWSHPDITPLKAGDILVIDGYYTNGTVTFKVEKSVIMIWEDESLQFLTDLLPNGGNLIAAENTALNGGVGFYFNMTNGSVIPMTTEGNWDNRFMPKTADTVKLIRDGVTTSIGNVAAGEFVKYGASGYYMDIAAWSHPGITPLKAGDILVIDGYYTNGTVTFKVEKSVIMIWEDESLQFLTDFLPNGGSMIAAENTTLDNGTGIHFNMTNGSVIPTSTKEDDWDNRFMPKTADTVKLIRDGVTTSIGNVAAGEFVKYGANSYYMDIAAWSHPGITPLKVGDILVFDGYYSNGTVTFKVEKSVVVIMEGNSLAFLSEVVDGGRMMATETGWHGNTVHFSMSGDVSAVPSDSEWKVRYGATESSNVKLIRNGETVDAARVEGGQIIAIGNGEFALAIETWPLPAIGTNCGQDGDILLIEGNFINKESGYVLHVDKTYVYLNNTNQTVYFGTSEQTDFGEVVLPASADTITYGVWAGSYHVFTDDKLAELKAAGITKLVGVNPRWIGDENKDENGNISMSVFLDRCQKYGISVVALLRSRTEDGQRYEDTWNGDKPDYAEHPALIGFNLYDEPDATQFASLAEQKAILKEYAPNKLVFVNLLPNCAGKNSLYGSIIANKTYENDYIDAFMEQFEPEVLSWDFYATLSGGKIRTDFFSNFEIMAKKNVTKWFTMLSCGHDTGLAAYDTPTEDELRWQMAVALSYGVSDIDHYTYVSHEDNYDCMVKYETWERTALYDDIEKVDNEYLSWGNIYKAYDYVGTDCVDVNSNQMLKELSNTVKYTDYGITSIATTEDLLVGIFDYNGTNAYMLTNAGKVPYKLVGTETITMADTTATLTLADGNYKCVAVISKGEITYMAVGADNTVEIPVGAYEGVFVIPVLN